MEILASDGWWPLLLAAILAFAESAFGLGAIFPGEVAITALAATLDGPRLLVAIVAVSLGATAGDHVGYFLGRHLGDRLQRTSLVRRVGLDRWNAATRLMQRKGTPAVLVSRLVPFVSNVMPAVAGVAGMGYGRFAAASVTGSILWAALWVGAGGAAQAIANLLSATAIAAVCFVSALVVVIHRLLLRRRRRRDPSPSPKGPAPEPSPTERSI